MKLTCRLGGNLSNALSTILRGNGGVRSNGIGHRFRVYGFKGKGSTCLDIIEFRE